MIWRAAVNQWMGWTKSPVKGLGAAALVKMHINAAYSQ